MNAEIKTKNNVDVVNGISMLEVKDTLRAYDACIRFCGTKDLTPKVERAVELLISVVKETTEGLCSRNADENAKFVLSIKEAIEILDNFFDKKTDGNFSKVYNLPEDKSEEFEFVTVA